MQTHDELMNDLIEALKTSSAYRQQQELQWRRQAIRECASFAEEKKSMKVSGLR
jgi:hypothetical protein